jgi:DUF438 domain-containing protein
MKNINLKFSIYQLVNENPELVPILEELGFVEVTRKNMLKSVGKVMTIPKGAKLKGIPMEEIIKKIQDNGFVVELDNVVSKIKEYLKRLEAQEELESVRADFAKEFENVDASEIMEAEQQLLKEGTPLATVQKLCDVHAALFKGKTIEEKVVEAKRQSAGAIKQEKLSITSKLVEIKGHPLYTFSLENKEIANIVKECKEKPDHDLVEKLQDIAIHYAKKGDLLYPHLKVKYGISGPSDVMWTVDDEIRDEIKQLSKKQNFDNKGLEDFNKLLVRIDDMIYKEANILFPNCATNFEDEEWYEIYRDSKDYDECLGVENVVWEEAEEFLKNVSKSVDDEIVMAGGHMTVEQLSAMLNTIPLEITFVDKENINRYFNEGSKVFKRPGMAIDREVFSCHPPKIEVQVRKIIESFKNKMADRVPIWMEKNGRTMLVTYMAVRNKAGEYLGTVEIVQDMEFAKEHFTK